MSDKYQQIKPGEGLQIGAWQYWADSGALKNSQQTLRLSTQLNQVMWLLLSQRPKVVSRNEFLEAVWADKYVNEDALSRTIAELRKVLGDSASQAKYIKTIPKKGYQWVHEVEPIKSKNWRQFKVTALSMMLIVVVILFLMTWLKEDTVGLLQDAVANANRVTFQPGMEKQSMLSEDGHWLVYVKDNTSGGEVVLESMADANQQMNIELAGHILSSPVFIPAKKAVLMVAKQQEYCYLKKFDLAEQVFMDLSACFFDSESRTLSWDETSESLLFSAYNNDNKVVIMRMGWDTGLISELTQPITTDEQDLSPELSPDQRWLSFSRGNQAVRNIWLKDLVTGEEKPLTQGDHYSVSHSWYDNEYIVFDSDRGGSRQLWMINIFDSNPQLLGAYGAQHPAFSGDKSIMTFQEVSYEANIWLLQTETDDMSRLVNSTKYDNYPEFSEAGDEFLFSSNRQDLSSVWLFDMVTQNERLLLSIPEAKLTRPSWYDNDQKVLMTINDAQGYGTVSVNLATMQSERIDFGQAHVATIAYQGGFLALAKSGQFKHQILRLENGQVDVLPARSVSRFLTLSDGRLVFSKTDVDGLYLYDLNSEQESLLTLAMNKGALNLWTARNQSVYFDRGGEHAGLWKIEVSTGIMTKVSENRPFSVGTSLSVNKQEDLILMSRTDRAESDILTTSIK